MGDGDQNIQSLLYHSSDVRLVEGGREGNIKGTPLIWTPMEQKCPWVSLFEGLTRTFLGERKGVFVSEVSLESTVVLSIMYAISNRKLCSK